mmetsp:Transcript_13777/g.23461  ORF Transcript_13777/g.23461 Transcript_13777/m.23461 type:complete len:95 (+) Transcript_13777:27-311(+)
MSRVRISLGTGLPSVVQPSVRTPEFRPMRNSVDEKFIPYTNGRIQMASMLSLEDDLCQSTPGPYRTAIDEKKDGSISSQWRVCMPGVSVPKIEE